MKNWLRRSILIGFSLTASLLAVECILFFLEINSLSSKYNILQHTRKKDPETYPLVQALNLIEDRHHYGKGLGETILPIAGISGCTTVCTKEDREWFIYKADRHGFNNDDEIWDEQQWDVLVLGDSFGQGVAVPRAENMVTRIRSKYKRTANLSIGGNGPLVELATLREFGRAKKPKLVIWTYVMNDLGRDLTREKESPLLQQYLNPEYTQNLIARQAEMDSLLKNFANTMESRFKQDHDRMVSNKIRYLYKLRGIKWLIYNTFFLDKTKRDRVQILDFEYPNLDYLLFLKILKLAKTEVESWQGKLILVYLPNASSLGAYPEQNNAVRVFHDHFMNELKPLNIPILDLQRDFENYKPDPLSLFADCKRWYGHFNATGYAFAGDKILEKLPSLNGSN